MQSRFTWCTDIANFRGSIEPLFDPLVFRPYGHTQSSPRKARGGKGTRHACIEPGLWLVLPRHLSRSLCCVKPEVFLEHLWCICVLKPLLCQKCRVGQVAIAHPRAIIWPQPDGVQSLRCHKGMCGASSPYGVGLVLMASQSKAIQAFVKQSPERWGAMVPHKLMTRHGPRKVTELPKTV